MDNIKATFVELFNSYADYPEKALDELFDVLKVKTIKKGTKIVLQGKPDFNSYYLFNGILREYIIDDNGKDITLNFHYNKAIVTPHFSRTNDNISFFTIQAIADCTIGEIDSAITTKYLTENKEFYTAASLLITKLFKHNINRQITQATYSGKNKLEQFRKDFPGIENHIPHSYIASYLGITNVSLSRLRHLK